LLELNTLQGSPLDSIGIEKMSKQFGQISDFVGFKSVNYSVFLNKSLEITLLIYLNQLTESLAQQSIKSDVSSFLHTAFNNHVADLQY
jgi:hypothetical protein